MEEPADEEGSSISFSPVRAPMLLCRSTQVSVVQLTLHQKLVSKLLQLGMKKNTKREHA
jgi:hypothetical protein